MIFKNIINVEKFYNVKYQVIATIAANIGCMGQGCSVGWFSPALLLLRSESTPLSAGPISSNDSGWIASFLALGAIVGIIFSGILCNYIGSKKSMILSVFPGIISWIIIFYAESVFQIGISRALSGISTGGIFTCLSIFVSEIADTRIRARLLACTQLHFYTGVMLGYLFGSILEYHVAPLVILLWPTVFISSMIFIPCTPLYLLRIDECKKAEESLRFYKNCSNRDDSYDPQREHQFIDEFLRVKAIAKLVDDSPKLTMSDFTTLAAARGLFISTSLFFISQFSGTITVTSFAAIIFRETGTTIDPNMSSIIMAAMQILGIICATSTINRFGRKLLLLVSTACAAIGLTVTGIYSYLHFNNYDLTAFSAVPVISLSFFIFSAAVGITPIPFVVMADIMPQKIRKIGAPLTLCSMWLYVLILVKIFPLLLVTIQLHGCMLAFACVAVGGFIFTAVFVPREKSVSGILEK